MKKRNMLFWIALVLAVLFVFSPLFLRAPAVKHSLLCFLEPLGDSTFKSSYIETVGATIGTILAITGTLMLQEMIDKKEKIEKDEQQKKEIRYKVVIIYYDLKLAFVDIAEIYKLLVWSAFLNDKSDKIDEFYESASKIELYIDGNWIRNVASLCEEFDKTLLEDIFLIYGDICSIRSGLKSKSKNNYQMLRLGSLICQFFSGVNGGEPELEEDYRKILERLKEKGNIKEDCPAPDSTQ